MLRALVPGFILSLSVLLAACGDESAAPAPSTAAPVASGTAGSTVVKGLIRNGIVTASRWQDGSYEVVATARTNDVGDFVIDIPAPVPGEVLRLDLGLSPDTSVERRTEMLCDVAQCGSAARGEWVPLTTAPGLVSWVSVGEQRSLEVMPMTPLSTLVVRHAEALGGGRMSASTLEVAQLRVGSLFRLSPGQLMARPGNIVNSLWLEAATPDSVKVALLSAAFAELATRQGVDVAEIIDRFADAFVSHDGHLLQASDAHEPGTSNTLLDLYYGIYSLSSAGGTPGLESWVQEWIMGVALALEPGKLNTAGCAPDCEPPDSQAFLAALGTAPDSLGGDLRRVMEERGAASLEELLANEMARYGWLAHEDSAALARLALRLATYSALSAFGFPSASIDGLSVARTGNVLQVEGSSLGFLVDLDITVPPVLELIQSYERGSTLDFLIGVKGVVQNGRIRATLDGTLAIDSAGTDWLPVQSALTAFFVALTNRDAVAAAAAEADLYEALAGIFRTGKGTFTLEGSARLASLSLEGDALVEASRLGVAGKAWLKLDMSGGSGGAILANGKVEHGVLELPNGDHFTVDPAKGHYLRFSLGADGKAELNIAAHVLGHAASVSGSGALLRLGALLGNLRNTIATTLEGGTLDLQGLLTQVLADIEGLALTVDGRAVIPDFGHTYRLAIADGKLVIMQPDGVTPALALTFMGRSLRADAGGLWWLLGVDLTDPVYPSLTLLDSSGGEWRWDFDLSGLVALVKSASVTGPA